MISPCSCRGTGGYVHEDCLRDWFRNRGEWFDLNCPQCKHAFYGPIGVDLATFALSQIQDEHGVDSTPYAVGLGNLASAFFRVGDYQKQRDLLERALSIAERAYGPERVEVAVMLRNLGSALGSLGDYQKQKDLLERA